MLTGEGEAAVFEAEEILLLVVDQSRVPPPYLAAALHINPTITPVCIKSGDRLIRVDIANV
jgi:hypothetical protein